MHEVFYCGEPGQQVFATYHPPSGMDRGEVAVICAPLFSEYMRTYLALREFALAVASRGWHVVRFDYRGAGDSDLDLSEIRLDSLCADVALVTEEAREIAGSRRVCAVGVRLGALIAAESHRRHRLFDRMAVWDPVTDGREFVESFTANGVHGDGTVDFAGYAASVALRDDLASARLDLERCGIPVTGVRTRDGVTPALQYVSFDCVWQHRGEDLMTPQPVLEALLNAVVSQT